MIKRLKILYLVLSIVYIMASILTAPLGAFAQQISTTSQSKNTSSVLLKKNLKDVITESSFSQSLTTSKEESSESATSKVRPSATSTSDKIESSESSNTGRNSKALQPTSTVNKSKKVTSKVITNNAPTPEGNWMELTENTAIAYDDPIDSTRMLVLSFGAPTYTPSYSPTNQYLSQAQVRLLDKKNIPSSEGNTPSAATIRKFSYGYLYQGVESGNFIGSSEGEGGNNYGFVNPNGTYIMKAGYNDSESLNIDYGPKIEHLYTAKNSAGLTMLRATGTDPTSGMGVEIILSPDDNGRVENWYDITNNSDTAMTGRFVKGMHTWLKYTHIVPNYAIGGAHKGYYLQDSKNNRLTMPVDDYQDGPENWTADKERAIGPIDGNTSEPENFLSAYFGHTGSSGYNAKGNEDTDYTPGELLNKNVSADLGMGYKWAEETIEPGQTSSHRFDVNWGVIDTTPTEAKVTKTVENTSTKDKKNRVGDTLKYTITASSTKGLWQALSLTDVISTNLADPTNIKVFDNSGADVTSKVNPTFDTTTRKIKFTYSGYLEAGQKFSVTFDTVIEDSGSGKTIRNTATVVGQGNDGKGNPINLTKSGSVDVVVEEGYKGGLEKQVKNETGNDADYASQTTGQYGDIVDYQMKYTVDSNSATTLTAGEIKDALPAGLELQPDTIEVKYDDGSSQAASDLSDITIKSLGKGESVTITFKAKITQKTDGKIANIANFSGTTSAPSDAPTASSEADINVSAYTPKPTVTKKVRNETSNADGAFAETADAYAGDSVEYQVYVQADDVAALSQVKLKDILPAQLDLTRCNGNVALYKGVPGKGGINVPNSTSNFDLSDFDSDHVLDIDALATKTGNIYIKNVQPGFYLQFTIGAAVKTDVLADVDEATANQGVSFDNIATVTDSSYGTNDGQGWSSNPATINITPSKTIMTKQVKHDEDADSEYMPKDPATVNPTPLEASVGDDLDYKVEIKNDDNNFAAPVSGVQLKDDFDGKLGANNMLTLTGIEIKYYSPLDPSHPTTENYSPAQLAAIQENTITLGSDIPGMGGYAVVTYKVHVNDTAVDGTTIPNVAEITKDSYGPNTYDTDKKPTRVGWFSNNAPIKISAKGKIIFRYVDKESNMSQPTKIAKEVTLEGKIGKQVTDVTDARIRPKHINHWTVIDEALTDNESTDLSGAIFYQAQKDNPVFSKGTQVITYRYEKSMLTMSADKKWDFGTYLNTQRDATYYLPAQKDSKGKKFGNGVNVEDYYGVQNWQLAVKQDGQFKDNEHDYGELTDAKLKFDNAQVDVIDGTKNNSDTIDTENKSSFELEPTATQSTTVMSYNKGGHFDKASDSQKNSDPDATKYDDPDSRILRYQFGKGDQADYSVGLHVPATTKRYKTHYQTTLTWTLTVAP